MNAIATLIHLLRTDLRRFRLFIGAFVVVHLFSVFAERLSLGPAMMAFNVLRLAQMAGICLLSLQVFLVDSSAHTRSQWWTRPVRAGTLLSAKVAYLAVALWLPMLLIYLGAWIYDGFSLRQLVLAAVELTLYVAGASLLFGGIAAASSSVWIAFGRVAGIAVGLGLFGWIVNVTDVRSKIDIWEVPDGMQSPVVALGLLAGGVICLAAVFALRKPRLGYLGLIVVATNPLWLPGTNRKDRLPPVAAPGITAVRPTGGADETVVFGNVALRGVPANHFVLPHECQFSFASEERALVDFRLEDVGSASWHIHSAKLEDPVLGALMDHLPSGVRLSNRDSSTRRTQVIMLDAKVENLAQPGRLAGSLGYYLMEAVYAGRLEMQAGARVQRDGHSLRFVRRHDDRCFVRATRPALAFSRRHGDGAPLGSWLRSRWVLAVVYPELGEASLQRVEWHNMGGPFPITVHANDRFDEPRSSIGTVGAPELHAILITVKSAHVHQFDWDDHLVRTEWENRPSSPGSGAGIADSGANERSVAEIESLDQLAAVSRRKLASSERKALVERAEGLFAADVEGALARAPWTDPVEDALIKSLGEHLQDSHQAALREALERDPRLVKAVEKRGWGEPFRDYVVARLARRSPHTNATVPRLAAQYRDPALYDDLRWQFVHGFKNCDPARLYPLLREMPGFDAPGALRDAWQRAVRTGDHHSLWQLALEHGLPGALESAVRILYEEGRHARRPRSGALPALRRVTGHEESWEAFYPWIEANAGRLEFDPKSGTYRLAEGVR